jgi:hypothetical protein
MNAMQSTNRHGSRAMWTAISLAIFTAVAYLLIAWNVLGVGDLNMTEAPPAIVYVAAVCYLLGGLLIILRNRLLLVFGAVINALVILFFFNLYQNRPLVMFSPGGLATKAAQLLLEAALIYIVISDWRESSSMSK